MERDFFVKQKIRQGIMGDVAEMMSLSPLVLDYARGVTQGVRSNTTNILRAVTEAGYGSGVEKTTDESRAPISQQDED